MELANRRNPTVLIWSIPTRYVSDEALALEKGRNPTVLIWSIPTFLFCVGRLLYVLRKSQSHRPDLVNSHAETHEVDRLEFSLTLVVAIPPS